MKSNLACCCFFVKYPQGTSSKRDFHLKKMEEKKQRVLEKKGGFSFGRELWLLLRTQELFLCLVIAIPSFKQWDRKTTWLNNKKQKCFSSSYKQNYELVITKIRLQVTYLDYSCNHLLGFYPNQILLH